MSISLVAAGTLYEDAGNTTGTATPTLPGGGSAPAAGDLLLAFFYCRNAGATFSTPSGWTAVRAYTGATSGVAAALFRKIAAGGDANPASDWSGGASLATVIANVAVFRATAGFHATTPILDIPGSFSAGTTSDLGPITGLTPTSGAGAVVIFGGMNNDAVATALGGSWTPVFDNGSALGSDAGIISEWQAWSSGAISNTTWTVTGSVNWCGIMVTLQEAASTPATISGAVATATSAGVAAVAATTRIATVTGTVATATSAAPESTFSGTTSATLQGDVSTATAAGIEATIAALRTVALSGEVSAATAGAIEAAILIARTVSGEVATATAAGLEAVIAALRTVGASGDIAEADAAGVAAAVLIARTILGEPATADAAAIAASVAALRVATITAEVPEADAEVIAAAVTTGLIIFGEVAGADAAGVTPVAAAVQIATLSGDVAQASTAAVSAVIAALREASLAGDVAEADADAYAAVVEILSTALVSGGVAAATAAVIETIVIALVPPDENSDRRMRLGVARVMRSPLGAGRPALANHLGAARTLTGVAEWVVAGWDDGQGWDEGAWDYNLRVVNPLLVDGAARRTVSRIAAGRPARSRPGSGR